MTPPRHVYETYIEAPPEKIWQALTDPAFTSQYFHGTHVDSTWAKGAPVYFRYPDGKVAVDGEVLETGKAFAFPEA